MIPPRGLDAVIDLAGLFRSLDTQWVRVVVAALGGGSAQMDHCSVLALNVEDDALRRTLRRFAREATAEYDSGNLGEDQHVAAQAPACQLEHSGLAGPGTAGDHDELRVVAPVRTAAWRRTCFVRLDHDIILGWVRG